MACFRCKVEQGALGMRGIWRITLFADRPVAGGVSQRNGRRWWIVAREKVFDGMAVSLLPIRWAIWPLCVSRRDVCIRGNAEWRFVAYSNTASSAAR